MPGTREKPFNLLCSFSLLSFLSIVLITSLSSLLLSRFLTKNMLERDAVVTMHFIQSVAEINNPTSYFEELENGKSKEALEEFFRHVVALPEVVRANVYSTDRRIIWSSHQHLIGHRFEDNRELEEALSGQLVIETGKAGRHEKTEHVEFDKEVSDFVENYIPIWNEGNDRVVGVVEVYKVPAALFQAISRGDRLVWSSALLGGLFLYGALFWIVRRASIVIKRQQEQLVASESMAAVGEMASAVAHGIRNPLATIRSSAELAEENSSCTGCEATQDIIKEVDRLGQWVRELLLFSQSERIDLETVQIAETVRDSLDNFARTMERQGVKLALEIQESLPPIHGDMPLLGQMFNGLIANALESMPNGGTLTVTVARAQGRDYIDLIITDTGQGIPGDRIKDVFKPFSTSKRNAWGWGFRWSGASLSATVARLRSPARRARVQPFPFDFPRCLNDLTRDSDCRRRGEAGKKH